MTEFVQDAPPITTALSGVRRAQAAIALRLAGGSYAEIAQTLGYANAKRAMVAVEQELAKEVTPETRERQRQIAGKRLERLIRGVWAKAIKAEDPEHLPAIREARGLIDRYARLYGLDAPVQIEVSNPSTAELERWVAEMQQETGPKVIDVDVLGIEA